MFWDALVGEMRKSRALSGMFFWLDLIAEARERKARLTAIRSVRRKRAAARAAARRREAYAALNTANPHLLAQMQGLANAYPAIMQAQQMAAFQQAAPLGQPRLADLLNVAPGAVVRYTPYGRRTIFG